MIQMRDNSDLKECSSNERGREDDEPEPHAGIKLTTCGKGMGVAWRWGREL